MDSEPLASSDNMSLENIAAGLFNFNPVQGLQAGTSMGAQMMQIALQSQQQQLDAGAKWDQAQLAGQRNALARRSQMFNELTTNLNRFDEQARQRTAEAWATGGGGGSSVMYPQSPSAPSQSQPEREYSLTESPVMPGGGGFNSEGVSAAPVAPTQEQSITMNQPAPIGGGSPAPAPGGKPFRMSSGQSAAPNQFVTASDESTGSATSFGAAPKVNPNIQTPMPQQSWSVDRYTDGVSPVGGFQKATVQSPGAGSFMQGPAMTPNVKGGQNQPSFANLPDYLETDANNRVDPQQLYGFMVGQFSKSKLNGFVPQDGARYGITTGSPEEWARFSVGLAELESGFRTTTVGDVGRFPGNSNGLYQLSPNDAMNYGLRQNPFIIPELQDGTHNARAAVSIMEKLATEDGTIGGRKQGGEWSGLSRYWGPLRRGVNPLNAKAVSGLQPLAAESAPVAQSGASKVDGGLFPPAFQPDGGQSQASAPSPTQFYGPQPGAQEQGGAIDFNQFPEYRAANEARTAYQQTLSEKMQNATKLSELRTRLMEVDQEMLAKDAEASALGLRQSDPLYKVAINPLRMQRSRIENEILGIQSQNQQLFDREKVLEKSAKDADAAWKIVQDRQRAFQRAAPDASVSASPDVIFDRYVDADPRTRMKMKASFVNDKEMMARLEVADEFLKSEGQGTVDDRAWKIGGSDYTLAELAQFYQDPGTMENPNPVREFVNKDPKLKREVEAMLPAESAAPAPAQPGADPVKAKIDSLF